MAESEYVAFFQHAFKTGAKPYPYQVRLATQPWPDTLNVPTGLGKTAAVILAWLYKRLRGDADTPRRLAYCLPLRTLVEQTSENARSWIENLVTAGCYQRNAVPKLYTLMGGSIDREWDLEPAQEAIIVGTQDQLLSRALNRGYGVSRFRWPVDFGLLNNDCMWVMDEVQLMGVGLTTSTQLAAFRASLGTYGTCRSLWMSATMRCEWLDSIDFKSYLPALHEASLAEQDKQESIVRRICQAPKELQQAAVSDPLKKENAIAAFALQHHMPGTLTLIVVNEVKRAQKIYKKLGSLLRGNTAPPTLCLLHSRFRFPERQRAMAVLKQPPPAAGTICVATQVVEAGLDISARVLITDLAPWAAMVQRFGRVNRRGEFDTAQIYWLDISGARNPPGPYAVEELVDARGKLLQLTNARPDNLPLIENRESPRHVIRKRDILELFDTSPDLSGLDIDVTRFVRDAEDLDVQVFWRDIPSDEKIPADAAAPAREELCRVPIAALQDKKHPWQYWAWDHLARQWSRPAAIAPGMVLMLRQADGGYSAELGWTGDRRDCPAVLEHKGRPQVLPEADESDRTSETRWETLQEHSAKVVAAVQDILAQVALPEAQRKDLLTAARWHDLGKAHPIAREAMGAPPGAAPDQIWAKTAQKNVTYKRRGFRHELASALALLANSCDDLAVYLAAAHHGKVRLSIRSLPHEENPPDARRFARGIWEGDGLPTVSMSSGDVMPPVKLSLTCMEIGAGDTGPSWLARMLALRDAADLGPYRLAFLEAILRCADWRASKVGE